MNGTVGTVVAVFRKPVRTSPVVRVPAIELRRGHGVVDDANAASGSLRQVLLVSAEEEDGLGLEPGALWENVTVAGFHLDGLAVGTELRLGTDAVVALTEVCEPCKIIKGATGIPIRELNGRRGMLAKVVADGTVADGDPVLILGAAATK